MWQGSARTNMARFADLEKLQALADKHGLVVTRPDEEDNFACLEPDEGATQDGDFPTFVTDEEGNEVELWDAVVELLEPDSVLIVQSVGADKLRTLSGNSTAFVRRQDGSVERTQVTISEIYEKAAKEFGIPQKCIGEVHYEDLPNCTDRPTQRSQAA